MTFCTYQQMNKVIFICIAVTYKYKLPSSRQVLEFFTLFRFRTPYIEDPFQGQTDVVQAKCHQSILCGLSKIFHQYIDFVTSKCQKEKNGRPDLTRPTFSIINLITIHLQQRGPGSMCKCHFSVHLSEPDSVLIKPQQRDGERGKHTMQN